MGRVSGGGYGEGGVWLCQASGNDTLNELLLEVGLAVQSPNGPRTKKGPLAAIDCHYSFILSFIRSLLCFVHAC